MVPVTALGDPRSTNLDPGSPSSIPAPAQSPQPPQTGPETCRSCNDPGLHTSATAIAPNQEIISIPPEFSKQVHTSDTAIASEASEIVHVSVTSLDGSSPPKSQESQAPKAAQSHKTQTVLADPPPPGPATPEDSSEPVPLPQTPDPAPLIRFSLQTLTLLLKPPHLFQVQR